MVHRKPPAATFALHRVRDLSHAYIGMQPLGMPQRDLEPEVAAPRVSEHEYLLLAEFPAQPADHFFGIGDHPIWRHCGRDRSNIVGDIGLARPALIPLNDGEVLLPAALVIPAGWHGRETRATVNVEQDRVATIEATHGNPLVDAADAHLLEPLDALGRDYAAHLGHDSGCLCAAVRSNLLRRDRTPRCARNREHSSHYHSV